MRHSKTICIILASLLVTVLAAAEPTVGANGWSNVPGTLEGTITARAVDVATPRPPLGYVEYLPLGYNQSDALTTWPLVVFISGLGEVGDGTDTVANGHQLMTNMSRHGPFRQLIKSGWDFPAIVIAVQPPGAWNNATILKPMFDYLQTRYRVDSQRIYLTGLSDGAIGALNFASQHPGVLAGIIPIAAGSGPNPGEAATIANLPMWTVHAFNDDESARTSTILWVDQVIRATQPGAAEVMSTYPGYAGLSYHMAVDSDAGTGLPIDPFGPAIRVPACTLTNGSTWIPFGSSVFGSALFNSWSGTEERPYAQMVFGTPPARGAKAGLMFRDSTAANAKEVLVAQGPNNEVFMQWRSNTGGTTSFGARTGGTSSVKWLRLVRNGSTFTGSYSVNGTDWVALGSRTVDFSGSASLAGLAVTSHNNSATYSQTFSSFEVGGASPGSLTDVDIGSPLLSGSAALAGGVWTVVGGGADIANAADQFNFAYQAVEGDQTLTVRVGENAPRLVVALGKADGVFLTQPYTGPTAVRDMSIQLPIGHNTTAYYDVDASAWAWQRNQNWDRTRPDGLIFTMCWYNNHSQAWIDTYSNGDCWDWLFSQVLVNAPRIIVQPQPLSRLIGTSAGFTVMATGSPPLTYQWKRGTVAIAGATTANYSINPVTLADDGGTFTVTIGNANGSVTTAPALLNVSATPIVPPSPVETNAGGGGGCGAGTATGLALGIVLLALGLRPRGPAGLPHRALSWLGFVAARRSPGSAYGPPTVNFADHLCHYGTMSMRSLRLVGVLLLLAAAQSAEPSFGRNNWTNIPGVMEGTVTTQPVDSTLPRPPLGFVVYLPKGYNPANQAVVWPLVVFCTGIGEIGNGTNTVANGNQLYANMTKHGPLHQITAAQWDFPGIVIAAQQPGFWTNTAALKPMMEYAKTNYRVDSTRIYLTGLCDGAIGVFNFAVQYPGYLAGILPIEVATTPKTGSGAIIRDLPMWAVHCFSDPSIARTSSIAWVDQTTQADVGGSDVMATYPGYAGKRYHAAADADPLTGLPLNPFGPITTVLGATFTSGSSFVGFGTTTFGSAAFNSWGGTEAAPYARLHLGAKPGVVLASNDLVANVISLGKPNGVFLTRPYTGPTMVSDVYLQIPVGYNTTAYLDATTATWSWQRGQVWDQNRPGKRIFTMCWYQNHVQGWRDTYANGGCWDWLFSQQTRVAPIIRVAPQGLLVSVGLPANFSVEADGTAPLTYQWARNGTVIAGATAATYSTPNTTLSDDGASFTVKVVNPLGQTLSAAAILRVSVQPVTVIDLADRQVVQRVIGTTAAPITISGTYNGTPDHIQARVVTVASGAASVNWTTIVAAPVGGVYSASVSVPQGGWYRLEVRLRDATGLVTASANGSAKWGVGINILCIGQSNMLGFGDNAFTVADDRVGLFYARSTWRRMADPWISGGKASCGPALGNALVAALNLPIGLVPSASGTTYMVGSAGNALSQRNSANPADPATVYGQALSAAIAAGGVEFVVVSQGANEAVAGTSTANYVNAFNQMRSNFAEDLPNGGAVVFALSQLGRRIDGGSYDPGYNAIREAHRQLDNGTSVLLAGATLDFPISDATSHYGGVSQATHGRRFARTLLHSLGLRASYGGPRIVQARFIDSLQGTIRVSLAQRGGSGFTPATGIPGFVVSDAAGPTVVLGVRVDGTSLDLTGSRGFTGAVTITYLAGTNPAGPLGLLVDDQGEAEPLLPLTVPMAVSPAPSQPASEPGLILNGWGNLAGVVEGSLRVRAVNTTLPKPPYGYLEYLPLGYDGGTVLWPLVIHLPSISEAGDGTDSDANGHQLYNQLVKSGPLRQVVVRQWDFPAIIIAPQVTTNWAKPLNVKNVIEYAKANYRVDVNRIYMSGSLEGANGTLRFAVAYPGDLAAVLTVEASVASSAAQATTIRNLPVWASHSFADPAYSRSSSIGWIDALAVAAYAGTSDLMATYPGYGGDRNHFAVDSDPLTRRPLNPNGDITTIAAAALLPGSRTIAFPSGTTFGSNVHGMWGGSDAWPFARVLIGGETVAYTSARGFPTSLTLTTAYTGPASTTGITIRTPVGYNVTAYRTASGIWGWNRDQAWDQAQPDQQILTLFWYQSAAEAWTRTWDNAAPWNWLFSHVRAPAGSS